MDCNIDWVLVPEADALVKALLLLKLQLCSLANEMWEGMSVQECDVYASRKMVEFLSLSDQFVPVKESEEEFSYENRRQRQYTASKLVADFKKFSLHEHEILTDNVVRMVVAIDGNKSLYGNVRIVTK